MTPVVVPELQAGATLQALIARYQLSTLPPDTPLPIVLKNVVRDDLPALFHDLGFTVGAEIGVWKAEYTRMFCEAGLRMIAVDPWVAYAAYRDHTRHHKITSAYDVAVATLSRYDCQVIRKFSVDAAKDVPDRSLDFVYIDGNHSFFDCVQDLTLWSAKVKSGGIISGHDYDMLPSGPGNEHIKVKEAVDGFTAAHKIAPWFLLSRRKVRPGEKHEAPRSFLWVNP